MRPTVAFPLGVRGPVNVFDIEEKLQILQEDPRIRSVEAQLVPSETRGLAVLHVNVVEADPFQLRLAVNNYQSPSIGSGRGDVRWEHQNISGFGDELMLGARLTDGLIKWTGRYRVPVHARDIKLDFHFEVASSNVTEEPFDVVGIRSTSRTLGFTIAQPIYRTLRTEVALSLTGDHRRGETFIFDRFPVSFTLGPINASAR